MPTRSLAPTPWALYAVHREPGRYVAALGTLVPYGPGGAPACTNYSSQTIAHEQVAALALTARYRAEDATVTTGMEVARAGAALLVFALSGLVYVHYVLPRLNDAIGFPSWHEGKWAKRWNYAILLVLCAVGATVTATGLVAWAAGWTFG